MIENATDIDRAVAMRFSDSDRALIQDDFRMIFSLEGNVLPHIADLFVVFDVTTEHADLFMDYYGSQILRLDKFGTIESGFGRNLNLVNLARIEVAKYEHTELVTIEPTERLQADIKRFKRRLILMKSQPVVQDCYVSEEPEFANEKYMFTKQRLSEELSKNTLEMILPKAVVYSEL